MHKQIERNQAIYEFLVTPKADGFNPTYAQAAREFSLSPQRVAQLFYQQCEEVLEAGGELPELHLREGRPPLDSEEAFLAKHGAVVEALQTGIPVKTILTTQGISKSSLYWVRSRAVELGLLTAPKKEVRPRKHPLPVGVVRNDGFVEIALNTPEAKKALAAFF